MEKEEARKPEAVHVPNTPTPLVRTPPAAPIPSQIPSTTNLAGDKQTSQSPFKDTPSVTYAVFLH